MLKMFYVNVKDEVIKPIELKPTLTEYYKLLDCDCITMVPVKIKGESFDLIADDEGLLKEFPIISSVDSFGNPMTVGNLLITRIDDEGAEISITEDDIRKITSSIGLAFSPIKPNGYPLLVGINY